MIIAKFCLRYNVEYLVRIRQNDYLKKQKAPKLLPVYNSYIKVVCSCFMLLSIMAPHTSHPLAQSFHDTHALRNLKKDIVENVSREHQVSTYILTIVNSLPQHSGIWVKPTV